MRVVIARNFENNVWTLDEMLETEIQAKQLFLSVTASDDDKSANRNQVGENLYTAAALIAQISFKGKCCELCNLKNQVCLINV